MSFVKFQLEGDDPVEPVHYRIVSEDWFDHDDALEFLSELNDCHTDCANLPRNKGVYWFWIIAPERYCSYQIPAEYRVESNSDEEICRMWHGYGWMDCEFMTTKQLLEQGWRIGPQIIHPSWGAAQ